MPEVLSVCSVQYKCVTDAQRRKASLPGRGLEYVDANGAKHEVTGFLSKSSQSIPSTLARCVGLIFPMCMGCTSLV